MSGARDDLPTAVGRALAWCGRMLRSRADIESHLYGWETPNSNSVEVRISQLRKKLESVGSTLRVRTIRNVGYVLQA